MAGFAVSDFVYCTADYKLRILHAVVDKFGRKSDENYSMTHCTNIVPPRQYQITHDGMRQTGVSVFSWV